MKVREALRNEVIMSGPKLLPLHGFLAGNEYIIMSEVHDKSNGV